MIKRNIFSKDRKYRYILWRSWDSTDELKNKYIMFIGLNPSTADEKIDDPTLRRCMSFAKSLGYSNLCMANLFAYRATDPNDLLTQKEPIGIYNDKYLVEHAMKADKIIAAWGTRGNFLNRDFEVIKIIKNLYCLGKTKDGFPRHPLYVRSDQVLFPFH